MAPAGSAPSAPEVALPMAELNHILYRVDRLMQVDWNEHSGAGLEDFLYTFEQIDRRLASARSKVIAAAEADALWALDGSRSVNTWLRNLTGSTKSAASRNVKLSRAVRDVLPGTGEALAEGQISEDHAQILAREGTKTEKLREQLLDPEMGEGFLLGIAEKLNADEFGKAVKHWAGMADPEAADRNWREATDKEEMYLSPTLDGYHLSGWLTPASGQVLETALTAQMGRRAEGDEREPAQRRAAALVSWAHSWLDSGDLKPGSRIRPHLSVHVPFTTLEALCEASGSAIPPGRTFTPGASAFQTLHGPGGPKEEDVPGAGADAAKWATEWKSGDDHIISTALDYEKLRGHAPATLDDGTPISASLLARIACGSNLTRIVFGPESTILDVGREQRIFPANQTRAIIARDRHCQFPSCTEPPEFGEIHHALWWWKHNGKTSTDQGVLLCWHHHSYVHEKHIMIARENDAWVFSTDQGKLIAPSQARAKPAIGADDELPFSRLTGAPAQEVETDLKIPPSLAWPVSQPDPAPPSSWNDHDPWGEEQTWATDT